MLAFNYQNTEPQNKQDKKKQAKLEHNLDIEEETNSNKPRRKCKKASKIEFTVSLFSKN